MELHQLRYLIKAADLGSIKAVARDMGVRPSAVSTQLRLLEEELDAALLHRTPAGVTLTQAGAAVMVQARLALRYTDNAVLAARDARISGVVGVGMTATTASLLAQPFAMAMRERYPGIRLHLVEALAGHLTGLLRDRKLDLAVLFQMDVSKGWSVIPVLSETLFVVGQRSLLPFGHDHQVAVGELSSIPLIMTSRSHGLRHLVEAAFQRGNVEPLIEMEVDGLTTLMSLVKGGSYATIQPGAAIVPASNSDLCAFPMADPWLKRTNMVTSVSDDELAPAALAARVVLANLMRSMAGEGRWPGARLLDW